MQRAIDEGVPEDRIGLASFTRAAAHELAKRAGVRPGKNISTLHSYAFRMCDMSREQVVDRIKLREFSKLSRIETTGASVYDQENLGPGDQYLNTYSYMRSTLEPDPKAAFYALGHEGSLAEFQYFIVAYEKWKQSYGYMDFADMLSGALDRQPPEVDVLFLDEAQDFAPAQWKLIESWVPHIGEMVLALDDDQCIYKFNGADPTGGPTFEERHGSERVVLKQSYRVPPTAHALADRLIKNTRTRVEKEYRPTDKQGRVRRYGDLLMVPTPDKDEDTLVLFRNHSLREDIEAWLQDAGVPYLTDNGRRGPLQRPEASAINIWRSLQSDYSHTGQGMLSPKQWALLRQMAMPVYARQFRTEDVGALIGKDWDSVLQIPAPLARYYKLIRRRYGTETPDTNIHLSTIHGVKGREAHRVILLNSMSQRTAEALTHDPDPEIRVFYVGVTRAKHTLDIVAGNNPLRHLL